MTYRARCQGRRVEQERKRGRKVRAFQRSLVLHMMAGAIAWRGLLDDLGIAPEQQALDDEFRRRPKP